MSDIKDLLNSIVSGDLESATQIFADTMNDRLQNAVEDRRIEIAQAMFNEGKSEYEQDKEEQEDESDDEESDDSEESDDKESDESDSDEKDGDVKTKKSGKKVTITVDEETEQLDEISQKTLTSYLKKKDNRKQAEVKAAQAQPQPIIGKNGQPIKGKTFIDPSDKAKATRAIKKIDARYEKEMKPAENRINAFVSGRGKEWFHRNPEDKYSGVSKKYYQKGKEFGDAERSAKQTYQDTLKSLKKQYTEETEQLDEALTGSIQHEFKTPEAANAKVKKIHDSLTAKGWRASHLHHLDGLQGGVNTTQDHDVEYKHPKKPNEKKTLHLRHMNVGKPFASSSVAVHSRASTVKEDTEQLDELVSPFSMHPANVIMKKAGIADNDFLPPPANFVTSVAARLGKKLASPSKPASSEAPAGLDKLGDDGKTCDSPGGCGIDAVGKAHKAVTDFSQSLSKAHRARFGANNPYLQKEETEEIDEAETTYTSSTGRIKATMQPGQPGTTIEPAPADKAAALKLKMSKTLSTK